MPSKILGCHYNRNKSFSTEVISKPAISDFKIQVLSGLSVSCFVPSGYKTNLKNNLLWQ